MKQKDKEYQLFKTVLEYQKYREVKFTTISDDSSIGEYTRLERSAFKRWEDRINTPLYGCNLTNDRDEELEVYVN